MKTKSSILRTEMKAKLAKDRRETKDLKEEQRVTYINRNTKRITLSGKQINSLVEQGKQAQQKEDFEEIRKVMKEILKQRRYLPSKIEANQMDYWIGDNERNRGIYVDLGGVIGKLKALLEKEMKK